MKRFLVLLFLLLPVPVSAAITFDAMTSAIANGADTVFVSHTVGGGCANPYLVANVGWYWGADTSVSGVTSTAGAMTQVSGGHAVILLTGTFNEVDTWVRAGTTGAQTVTATMAAAPYDVALITRSYCGVHQTVSLGTPTTEGPTDGSISVAADVGELAIDAIIHNNFTMSPGSGQTQREEFEMPFAYFYVSDKPGTGTVTMSWSPIDQGAAMVGMALKPASATAPSTVRTRVLVIE